MDYYKLKILNNKRKIIIFLVIVLLIGGLLFYYFNYYQKDEEIKFIKNDSDNENKISEVEPDKTSLIIVDIKGYVEKPGVYSFSNDSNARINDLILKAGGLKKDADTSLINLSRKLEDEMTIIIYSKKEVNDYLNGKNELKEKLELCELKLKNNACIEKEETKKEESTLININSASKEELMTLSGIGEAKADAIIKYRKNNSFKKIEDLKNVEGIGESLFESIKASITV